MSTTSSRATRRRRPRPNITSFHRRSSATAAVNALEERLSPCDHLPDLRERTLRDDHIFEVIDFIPCLSKLVACAEALCAAFLELLLPV